MDRTEQRAEAVRVAIKLLRAHAAAAPEAVEHPVLHRDDPLLLPIIEQLLAGTADAVRSIASGLGHDPASLLAGLGIADESLERLPLAEARLREVVTAVVEGDRQRFDAAARALDSADRRDVIGGLAESVLGLYRWRSNRNSEGGNLEEYITDLGERLGRARPSPASRQMSDDWSAREDEVPREISALDPFDSPVPIPLVDSGSVAEECGGHHPIEPEATIHDVAALARLRLDLTSLEDCLSRITSSALREIPGSQNVAIACIDQERVSLRGPARPLEPMLNEIIAVVDISPFTEAIRTQEVVRVCDLATDPRWPSFRGPEARSILCLPLLVSDATFGALCLFSTHRHAFGERSKSIGAVYAAYASVGIAMTRRIEELNAALESRATIDQAKGIIMATTNCSSDSAFALLRDQSHSQNLRLRDIATELVERYASFDQ